MQCNIIISQKLSAALSTESVSVVALVYCWNQTGRWDGGNEIHYWFPGSKQKAKKILFGEEKTNVTNIYCQYYCLLEYRWCKGDQKL